MRLRIYRLKVPIRRGRLQFPHDFWNCIHEKLRHLLHEHPIPLTDLLQPLKAV